MVNLSQIPVAAEQVKTMPPRKMTRLEEIAARRLKRIRMGQELLAMKARVGHGQWLKFVESGALGKVSLGVAARLMREASAANMIIKATYEGIRK